MMFDIEVINASKQKYLPKKKVKEVIQKVFLGENKKTAKVNVIFLDIDEIKSLNKQYLNHNYPTDVLAFSFEDNEIDGEIYICAQIAKSQAKEYSVSTENEIMRLAAHGALHLIGYKDDTESSRNVMNKLETTYISN